MAASLTSHEIIETTLPVVNELPGRRLCSHILKESLSPSKSSQFSTSSGCRGAPPRNIVSSICIETCRIKIVLSIFSSTNYTEKTEKDDFRRVHKLAVRGNTVYV